jgi:hypothetical protein
MVSPGYYLIEFYQSTSTAKLFYVGQNFQSNNALIFIVDLRAKKPRCYTGPKKESVFIKV